MRGNRAIEVRNQAAWHRYLSEVGKERAALAASVSSNPIVSNSLEVRDLIGTAGFDFTNSWVLGGQKEIVTGTIFENDYLVIQQETGEQVARIANLHLTTPGFGQPESWDCISNYSQLYRSHM